MNLACSARPSLFRLSVRYSRAEDIHTPPIPATLSDKPHLFVRGSCDCISNSHTLPTFHHIYPIHFLRHRPRCPAIAGHLEIAGRPLRIPLDHLATALPIAHAKLAANKRQQLHSDDLLDSHTSPLRLTTSSNTIIYLPTWTTTNHSSVAHRLWTTTRRNMSHSKISHGKTPPRRRPPATQAP